MTDLPSNPESVDEQTTLNQAITELTHSPHTDTALPPTAPVIDPVKAHQISRISTPLVSTPIADSLYEDVSKTVTPSESNTTSSVSPKLMLLYVALFILGFGLAGFLVILLNN